MAVRKGRLVGVYRWRDPYSAPDDWEWTFVFKGVGSLDMKRDGSFEWDPNGDLDWSEDEDIEQYWSASQRGGAR